MAQTILTADTLLHGESPPPAATPRLLPGTVISHYEILGQLGVGGMGTVYRARDQRIGRPVAIKLRKASAGAQTSCRLVCTLLMREGQAMGQLSHPNVLAVYDVGLVRGCVFLALEYVEGATLREWGRGERTTRQRIDALIAAGRGLAAAHAANVIHRDFKPDNVLVGNNESVKVCDFGLARTRAEILDWGVTCGGCGAQDAATELASVDNDFAGTPRYMAPEQLGGEPATPLSDQYAFAVTAWEVVCGTYPFVASTVGELRAAIAADRMSEPLRPVVPAVADALRRAMNANPERRFSAMPELLGALAEDE